CSLTGLGVGAKNSSPLTTQYPPRKIASQFHMTNPQGAPRESVGENRYRCAEWLNGTASAATISLPIGHSAVPASFRRAPAKGMPMIVTASTIAVMRWPSASPQPASTSQMTLPRSPNGTVPRSCPEYSARDTAFLPNGNSG